MPVLMEAMRPTKMAKMAEVGSRDVIFNQLPKGLGFRLGLCRGMVKDMESQQVGLNFRFWGSEHPFMNQGADFFTTWWRRVSDWVCIWFKVEG